MSSKKPQIENPGLDIEATECADVAARLAAEVAARFGPREEAPLSITMRDGAGALLCGLNGVTHWRWLYVRHLWVAESQRGRGLARRLMESAERAALARVIGREREGVRGASALPVESRLLRKARRPPGGKSAISPTRAKPSLS
jgi:GNAT superfamily N-acetyltransferase